MRKYFSIILLAGLILGAISCKSNKENGSDSDNSTIMSIADMNKQEGENYIADMMKKDPSFKKTSSGLCYKILNEGEGENFKPSDVVDVIYTGKHIDGSEFDSSKGETVQFPLQSVVPGFREVITLMKPGAKAIAIIPGHLGYGDKGTGPIGPNETLVFELTTVALHQ